MLARRGGDLNDIGHKEAFGDRVRLRYEGWRGGQHTRKDTAGEATPHKARK
ncbi:hypothetical protein I79_024597 [Cricetulus griseus]|uniref:Uncharacterized protein n=1 Tax=Cricetulus griseus TaxID=10029 RepID=G3IL36_CRIGR|nr:hypothetical protein I79_024597 [Cricetulus griseus]